MNSSVVSKLSFNEELTVTAHPAPGSNMNNITTATTVATTTIQPILNHPEVPPSTTVVLTAVPNSTATASANASFDYSTPVDLSSSSVAASPMTPRHDINSTLDDSVQGSTPELKVTENDSIRDLIMSAIGVMKSRKARPDTKRISSWIHRRYGKPVAAVAEELERLVTVGELARVDYKGSASFRITTSGAKMRRKRKCNKPLGRTPSNNPVALGGVLPPMFRLNPDGSGPQLTLHRLVTELLNESPQPVRFEQGLTIPTKFIAKAVESTSRDFSRAAVLGNLDIILERECGMGLFQKMDNDNYRLLPLGHQQQQQQQQQQHHMSNGNGCPPLPMQPPPPPSHFHQFSERGGPFHPQMNPEGSPASFGSGPSTPMGFQPIMSMQPQPPSSPHSPFPQQGGPSSMMKNPIYPAPNQNGPQQGPNFHGVMPNGMGNFGNGQFQPNQQGGYDKSDEQIKNDLIRCQLNKMSTKEAKAKSPNKRTFSFSEESNGIRQRRPDYPGSPGQAGYARRLGDENDKSDDSADESRSVNGRKKKSRKMFDEADGRRMRMTESPSGNFWPQGYDSEEMKFVSPDICIHCKEGAANLPKRATEAMLRCKDCPTRAHPACLNYTESLAQRALNMPWQCNNCKACSVCQRASNKDCMVSCDSCDLAFHLPCHQPPMSFKPAGRWECYRCQPMSNTNFCFENGVKMTNGVHRPQAQLTISGVPINQLPPPVAGPFNAPHTGVLPNNWPGFDADVPDISNWSPAQISSFFAQHGYPQEVCSVFVDQELDGKSLLLMQRNDVVNGLGLKLGPALKVFNLVKKFQMRQICAKTVA